MNDSWIDTGRDHETEPIGDNLIDYVYGSLADERRKPRPKTAQYFYNKDRNQCLRKYSKFFTLSYLLKNPDDFNIKLSESEACYPNLSFEINFGLQEITGSDIRKIRAVLFWYLFEAPDNWINILIEESFAKYLDPKGLLFIKTETRREKISEFQSKRTITLESVKKSSDGTVISREIRKKQLDPKISNYLHGSPEIQIKPKSSRFYECMVIFQQYSILGKSLCRELLEKIYSKSNIAKYIELGRSLIFNSRTQIVKIPRYSVKNKVQRRGYHETSSNKHKSKSQEERVMKSEENLEYERTIESIKLKQAKLFEQRLDAYLELVESGITDARKKELFSDLLVPKLEKSISQSIEEQEE